MKVVPIPILVETEISEPRPAAPARTRRKAEPFTNYLDAWKHCTHRGIDPTTSIVKVRQSCWEVRT